MKTVKLPSWWTGSKKPVLGTTDGIDTYCCSAIPCWFVDVPEFNYSGYFQKSDLVEV